MNKKNLYNKFKRASRFKRLKKFRDGDNKKDWCTMSPENINGEDIAISCCKPHDLCYLKAIIPRVECDKKFKECLSEKVGIIVSYIMWGFVRTFGWFFYGKT